jgi:acetylornithine/succinyldiaminopimelate/putrescine aminotransferase
VVVGAGPAGITLALELADAGHRTLLIESGGNSYNADTQHLGDTVGEDPTHVPMSLATRRQVGGASNLWAGRCVPFDPVDFRERSIVGGARWPVSYGEMETYFSRACEWCMCGEPVFDATQVPSLARTSLIPGWPDGDVRATTLERWSLPTNFGRSYRARLMSSPNLTLVSGLTCTEIVCGEDGNSVDHLVTRTLSGATVRVRGRRHVLACGGVESTRLLLSSRRHHAAGIGNHAGHLGRWYMTHLGASIAQVHFTTPPRKTLYSFERDRAGVYVRRRFTFSQQFLLDHDLPNVAMWLENPDIGDPSHGNAILSFIYLALASPLGRYFIAEGIRRRKIESGNAVASGKHLLNIMRNLPRAAWFALTFGYQRYLRRSYKAPGIFVPSTNNVYRLYYHGEHLPYRDSYIALSDERDALGMPRIRTHLSFQDDDVGGALRAHELFDRYLRRHSLGHLEYLYEDPAQGLREQLLDGYHQAGTTRMSAAPEDGVLDAHLAVHGFEDLFVASSSAFVTSGQANSTFMIVVFALRLADRLRATLRERAAPPRRREPPVLAGGSGETVPRVREILATRVGEEMKLNNRYLNPQIGRIVRAVGFDRVWTGGEGAHLIDSTGQRYLDLFGGHGVFALGRNHPEVVQAIEDVLAARTGNLPQLGVTLLSGVLAEELLARAPASVGAMMPANMGADAVEGAIKVARAATGRPRILYADGAFHGLTLGALSLNGNDEFREGFGPLLPACDRVPFGDLDALERELRKGDVAAFMIEPIQGKGVVFAPDGYLAGAQSLCRSAGTLFVCDEVQTGIGRTGRLLALEHWGLEPDMIVLSKALSGGFIPIGAVLVARSAFERVFDRMKRAVRHGSTFGGNDLAAAAALATLRALEREDLIAHAQRMGDLLLELTRPLLARYEIVRDVRGQGLMWGIELGPPGGRRSMWSTIERTQPGVFSQLVTVPLFHDHHIFCQVAGRRMNVIKALPALVIEESEIRRFACALEEVLADAEHASRAMVRLGWRTARRVSRERLDLLGQRGASPLARAGAMSNGNTSNGNGAHAHLERV